MKNKDNFFLYQSKESSLFSCECCGNCCQNWNFPIDKGSFERINHFISKDPRIEERYKGEDLFLINKDKENGEIQNIFIKRKNGRCIFLEEDNFCFLHKNYGRFIKPNICISYPYIYTSTNKGIYKSLNFSCPKAVKLLNYKGEFHILESEYRFPFEIKEKINLFKEIDITFDTYYKLEEKILRIIKEEDLSLEDRLIWASKFTWRTYKILRGDRLKEGNFEEKIDYKKPNFENRIKDLKIQLKFLITLINRKMDEEKEDNFFKNRIKSIYNALNINLDRGLENINYHIYEDTYQEYFKKDLKNYSNILKNLFLNIIFGKHIFHIYGVLRGYQIICITYSLIRFYFLSLYNLKEGKNLNKKEIIEAITFIFRYFLHSRNIFDFWKKVENTEIMAKPLFTSILLNI